MVPYEQGSWVCTKNDLNPSLSAPKFILSSHIHKHVMKLSATQPGKGGQEIVKTDSIPTRL